MAYTNTWDESSPLGSVDADTLDTIIQQLKLDIRERMNALVDDWANDDPQQPKAGYPYGIVSRAGAQSISDSTTTQISWSVETADVGAMIDLGTQATRITIPTGLGGLYMIAGGCTFAANATGYRTLAIYLDGAVTPGANMVEMTPIAGTGLFLSTTTLKVLTAGQYIELSVFQNSTGALDVTDSQLAAVRLA